MVIQYSFKQQRDRMVCCILRKNKNKLSTEKIKEINDIGFVWDPYSFRWEKNIVLLKKFKEKHGHLKVPTNNKEIGIWVGSLRTKKDELPLEKIKELDDIGFIWDLYIYIWEEYFTFLN